MRQQIAVLGGGPMGLAVAHQLCKDGFQPVLFEASDRLGGMAATFDFNGLEIERYYHFHCLSDQALLDILDELEMPQQIRWTKAEMGFWFQGRLQSLESPVDLLAFKGLGPLAKIRYGLHAFLAVRRKNWRPLDGLDAISWIRRWVGSEAYEVLWRKLFDYKFYEYGGAVSAAWIWSRINRLGRSRYSLFHAKLGYLEGGSGAFLQAMKTAIEGGGGEIRLQSPVAKVVIRDGQVRGLETKGRFEPFHKVVSTVPLPYLPKLMPDLPAEVLGKFRSIDNIAVVCVIVMLRKAVSPYFWVNVNDPNMDIPGLVEYTNLRPLRRHIVYVPFYMPGSHPKYGDADEVFVRKVKLYLRTINPSIAQGDFLAVNVHRYRYAQPIGERRFLDKLPPAALPVQGLWAADTSYYYPADRGISESVEFGRRLAKEVAAKDG